MHHYLILILLVGLIPLAYAGDSPPIVSPDDPRFGIVDIILNIDPSDGSRFITVEYGSNVDPGTVVGKSLTATPNGDGSVTIGIEDTGITHTFDGPLTTTQAAIILEIVSSPATSQPAAPAGNGGILTFTGNDDNAIIDLTDHPELVQFFGQGVTEEFAEQMERDGLIEKDPYTGRYTITNDGTVDVFVTATPDGTIDIIVQKSDGSTTISSAPISPGRLLFAIDMGLDLEDIAGFTDEQLGIDPGSRADLPDESGVTQNERDIIDNILNGKTTPGSVYRETNNPSDGDGKGFFGPLIESIFFFFKGIFDAIMDVFTPDSEGGDASISDEGVFIPVGKGPFGGAVGRDGTIITNPESSHEFNGPYGTSGSDDNTDPGNYDSPDSPDAPPITPPVEAPNGWEPFTPDGTTPIKNPNDGGSEEMTPDDNGEPIIIADADMFTVPDGGNTAPTPLAFILNPSEKIIHEPRWRQQCKAALEGNHHWLEETWRFAAYEWETVCMSIKMDGGYVLFLDFNGNDMIDGCNEMLCNVYWKQTYTVYDVLDQPLINQDNNKWFDKRDPLWQFAKAWRPTEGTIKTMDQLGIQAITVRDEIKVKNDYMEKGAYTNDSMYTKDWRYDEAIDHGWRPLNISLHEMRIVAWHPEGLVMKNGAVLPTYDFLIGYWNNETVQDVDY